MENGTDTTTTTTVTYQAGCPCGCGQTVEADLGGFASTTCTVAACDRLRATGVVSYTVPKSRAPEAAAAAVLVRHQAGLVTFELAGEFPVAPSLTGHVAGCEACQRGVAAHDAATPACGDLHCERVELCPEGARLRDAAWAPVD